MAENSENQQDKTESPTQRRIEEAFKKGQIIQSREVLNFAIFSSIILLLFFYFPNTIPHLLMKLKYYLFSFSDREVTTANIKGIFYDAIFLMAKIIIVPLLSFLAICLFSFYFKSGRFVFSSNSVEPDLSRISPLGGFKRIFSTKSLVEFIKNNIKIILVSLILYLVIRPNQSKIFSSYAYELNVLLKFFAELIQDTLITIVIITFFMAIFDYMYQRFEFFKSLRMSKQDLKEEYKQTEGNPDVKAKMKKTRMERSKKRMMAAVPKANVIITNPTHYAIALQYDRKTMNAPILVAKGLDLIAQKIKEIAKKHKIPIVENKILARSLYENVEIDEQIPVEYYKAVAEVISYVYSVNAKNFN